MILLHVYIYSNTPLQYISLLFVPWCLVLSARRSPFSILYNHSLIHYTHHAGLHTPQYIYSARVDSRQTACAGHATIAMTTLGNSPVMDSRMTCSDERIFSVIVTHVPLFAATTESTVLECTNKVPKQDQFTSQEVSCPS